MSRLWKVVQEAWAARQAQLGDREALHELTPREREVLALLAEGKTDSVCVSVRTASTHISCILSKLGVSSRLKAVLMWQHRVFR